MSRTSFVAVIAVAMVGLLLAGMAVYGGHHGWDTRFTWCGVLACVYAAVLTWVVDVTGVIRTSRSPAASPSSARSSSRA